MNYYKQWQLTKRHIVYSNKNHFSFLQMVVMVFNKLIVDNVYIE